MTITISDPITVNDERLVELQKVIDLALKSTGLSLATVHGMRCTEKSPYTDLGRSHVFEISFGLLTSKVEDTRKSILGFRAGQPPRADFVGIVTCIFAEEVSVLDGVEISVFGLAHKNTLIGFAEKLQKQMPQINEINVEVERREPKWEHLPDWDGPVYSFR